MNTTCYNVRKFGAAGDGLTKDTSAIQQAIDACADAGGGKVLLPPGRYISGTIYLKSNIQFHLSAGAVLVGSSDREDYNSEHVFPENEAFSTENVTATHLIIAYRQQNVSISGSGTIDGNSSAFFAPLPEGAIALYRWKSQNYPIISWRPGQMIFFCRCHRVAVRDVQLKDSPYWGLFALGCEDVQIRGLTIDNPPATQNGDGIDIDCSRNVTISDCIIRSGDDCITVRANKRRLGEDALPCENITVTNCVLSTPCNAIRVGVGDGEIRRCTFNNIIIKESRTAISIVSRYSPRSEHGTCIENVHFSDFIVDAVNPIAIGAGTGALKPAAIRDISFCRFRVKAWAGSQFAGTADVPLQRIRFSEIDWQVCGGTDNCAFVTELPAVSHMTYHGMNGQPALPCALYCIFLQDVSFHNVRIRWDDISSVWRYGFVIDRSVGADFRYVRLRQPHDGGAAIRCRQCHDIALTGCRADHGTLSFLQLDDSPLNARLHIRDNDLGEAKYPITADVPFEE